MRTCAGSSCELESGPAGASARTARARVPVDCSQRVSRGSKCTPCSPPTFSRQSLHTPPGPEPPVAAHAGSVLVRPRPEPTATVAAASWYTRSVLPVHSAWHLCLVA
eukprot:2217547-Rhodomonas_salina.1